MSNGAALRRAEQRAVEVRVAALRQAEADAVIERAINQPTWARREGWTAPVDTAEVAS